ncbi:N-terminal EF-hand calcium binding protein 1 [Cricetulus griseus]
MSVPIHVKTAVSERKISTAGTSLRQGPAKPEVLSIQWPGKRSSRRVQRHNSFSPNSPQFNVSSPALLEEDNQWMTQINRLQKLIDRLEKKDLKLEPLEEEVVEESTKPHIMLVQRQMSVSEDDLEEFQLALKHYVESASAQSGCLRYNEYEKMTTQVEHPVEGRDNSSLNSMFQMYLLISSSSLLMGKSPNATHVSSCDLEYPPQLPSAVTLCELANVLDLFPTMLS